jgi:hypothetical protein
MPKAVIASELASGQLCALPTSFVLPQISFTASFVSGSLTSPLMKSLASDARAFLAPRLAAQTYIGTDRPVQRKDRN